MWGARTEGEMSRFVIVALALLASCAPQVDATELGGVARWGGIGPSSAVAEANVHCQRYGRVARVTQTDGLMQYITFSCERP